MSPRTKLAGYGIHQLNQGQVAGQGVTPCGAQIVARIEHGSCTSRAETNCGDIANGADFGCGPQHEHSIAFFSIQAKRDDCYCSRNQKSK